MTAALNRWPGRSRGGPGWWRRNWWGLAAVLPILLAAVLLSPNESYDRWRDSRPQAVTPDGQGWVSYGGGRLRLTGLGPVQLRDFAGGPFPLPAGVRAWQATVTVDRLADPEALAGCEFQLEDQAGRLFGDSPSELLSAYGLDGDSLPFASCTSFEEGTELGPFETVATFLLPATARPAALRVSQFEQAPAYARLGAG